MGMTILIIISSVIAFGGTFFAILLDHGFLKGEHHSKFENTDELTKK